MKRNIGAWVLGLAASAAFAAAYGGGVRECVVYDAAVSPEAATETALVLKGEWNLAEYGELVVELQRGATAADGGSYCPCAHYAVRLESADGGVFSFGVRTELSATAFSRPLPPDLGNWKRIEAVLPKIRLQGLRFLIWPSPYWQMLDGGFKEWSLDARHVVRVTVSCDGYLVRLPPVKRIVAHGPANRLGEQPAFAKLDPEHFFPFLDRYGQFVHRDWPGKIKSVADLVRAREVEAKDIAAHPGPKDWDKWGGWAAGPQLKATGHFRVEKVDGQWWFVDPDGRLWWSHGPVRVSMGCCLTGYKGREHFFEWLPEPTSPFAQFYRPEDKLMWPYYEKWGVTNVFDFTSANLFRKYGDSWRAAWREIAHRRLRSWGANTIANGSDPELSLMDRTPYCDRFDIRSRPIAGTVPHSGWWPFPDPFDHSLREEMRRQMALHKAEMDDPWCFGFFVDNEHATGHEPDLARWTWESPDDQPAKREFRWRLAAKYGRVPAEPSEVDCCDFSRVLLEEYFRIVREEFKRAAPHKLYLGCRFSAPDPFSVLPAGKYVDVMSFNCYRWDVVGFPYMPKEIDKPVMIGEFHFGAMDRGPVHPSLLQCKDQQARAEAYKRYVTSALRDPRFVGVHWHQYFDTPATGRFDGENFQNGWVDVCDTPYVETIEAVRWIGENMYRIRRDQVTALSEARACPDADVAAEFKGYAVQALPSVKTLDAFDDPEFEGRGKRCVQETECVTYGSSFGMNGSGGLRVRPKPATKLRVDFPCKATLVPGRKYIFSILRRRNENGFAHVFWSCYDRSGKGVKENWNMKCRKLPAGWEEVEIEVTPPAGVDIARHGFSTIVQAAGFTVEKKNNPNAWVDFDVIGLREDVPEWLLSNTWPIHNWIYRESGRVRFCSSFVGEVVPPASRVRYLVELLSAEGRALGTRVLADDKGVFTADFGRLEYEGDARLKVSLMDDTRRVCAGVKEIPVTVVSQPSARPDTISVAEDGRCYMNGRTFMPVGFFTSFGKGTNFTYETTARRLAEMEENGYNCISEYWTEKWDREGARYYDLCARHGISVLYNLNQIYHNATDEGIARFCAKARKMSVHKAIVAWYSFDEVTKDWAPFLEKFRRALEKTTPEKVAWYVNIHEPEPMLPCGDIQGGDIYPIDVGERELEPMDRYVARCMRCNPGSAWHCPQAMNWGNTRPELAQDRERYLRESREPTENEYLSVALLYASHGVKGFIFYSLPNLFSGPVPELYEKRWDIFKSIGRTMSGLEPFIMGGKPIIGVPHTDVKGRTRLVRLESEDGRKVILAIGLKRDNECAFVGLDGKPRVFRGKDFSCAIYHEGL